MKNPYLFILFFLLFQICGCSKMNESFFKKKISGTESDGNELVFIGKIINVRSNGIVVSKNNERFVIVNVNFVNIDTNERIWIEYHIMRTNPDIESVKIDRESLFNWTFRIGNIYHVRAKNVFGKYIEEIYSVQELYFEMADDRVTQE